jgi:hypothetical protein
MPRWIPTSKGASSLPQSSGGASAGMCFGFGPTAAGQAMARATMAVVLVVVALFLAFVLVPEAVVARAGATWDAAGSPTAARENCFKAKARSGGASGRRLGGGSGHKRAGMRDRCGRGRGCQSNSGFHIFTRVSGCVVHNMCVRFSVAQE